MRKERGKLLRTLAIAVLVVSLALTNVSMTFSIPKPYVAVEPQAKTVGAGATFIVNVTAKEVWVGYGLFDFDINMTFDPDVLNCSGAEEGPFLTGQVGDTYWNEDPPDNENGWVHFYCSAADPGLEWGAYGNGTLAKVAFKALTVGSSNLNFSSVTLLTKESGIPQPMDQDPPVNGTVTVAAGNDVAVTSISAPDEAASSSTVPINVTVKNEGSATEEVNVTIRYDSTYINSQNVTVDGGNSTTVPFTWETTGVVGTYNITANATIPVDDDLTDNSKKKEIRIVEHDVAVTDVDAPSEAKVGESVSIDVTVQNQGNVTETLNVTVSHDATLIGYNDTVVLPMNKTDMWTGDNNTVTFLTTGKPVVSDSEEVYVNETLMSKPANYTIDYEAGNITFTTAPGEGANVTAKYVSRGTIVPFSWSTAGLDVGTYTINATATIPTIPVDDHPNDNNMTREIELYLLHDVNITNIEAPTYVPFGDTAYINVTVLNEGDYYEEANVTLEHDGTLIGNETVSLAIDQSANVTFTWDTSYENETGQYTVWAKADVLPTVNNTEGIDNDMVDNFLAKLIILAVHDVAVVNITTPTHGYPDSNVIIDVTVTNEGYYIEEINVTLKYDSVLIGNETISLVAGQSLNVTFTWYTTSVTPGSYNLTANATVLPSDDNPTGTDNDLGDNTLPDVPVFITNAGDSNGDGTVDDLDLSELNEAYGSEPGDSNWDPYCDFKGDNKVDALDLFDLSINYGETV